MSSTGGPEQAGDAGWADSADPTEPAPRARRRRVALVAVVALAVVAAAGAGFAAGTVAGGGGTQPEDVLPDTVLAYVDVDLDPAAQQKLNLVRLLGRFPDVEREYGSEPDVRTVVINWLVAGTELEDAAVSDWIGDRVGVGLSWDPEAEALTPVAAIQATDESEAVADLGRVLDADQIATSDGYVVVTGDLLAELEAINRYDELDGLVGGDGPSQQTAAQVVAAGQNAPLAGAEGFTEVFGHLDDGLFTMYVDGEKVAAAGEHLVSMLGLDGTEFANSYSGSTETGQVGAVLRAEPDALELLAWSSAAPTNGTEPVALTPTLPASTLFAVEVTGGSRLVSQRWDQTLADTELQPRAKTKFERALADLEAQYGIALPDDLETLVGDDVVAAVDGEGLLTSVPGIGVRSLTDPSAGAVLASRIESALASVTGGFGITAHGTDDGMVVASTEDYAAQLESADGDLGSDPAFAAALPDAATASSLVWLDFSAIGGFVSLAAPEASGVVGPLESLGVTLSPDDGGSRVRMRLVFADEGGT